MSPLHKALLHSLRVQDVLLKLLHRLNPFTTPQSLCNDVSTCISRQKNPGFAIFHVTGSFDRTHDQYMISIAKFAAALDSDPSRAAMHRQLRAQQSSSLSLAPLSIGDPTPPSRPPTSVSFLRPAS